MKTNEQRAESLAAFAKTSVEACGGRIRVDVIESSVRLFVVATSLESAKTAKKALIDAALAGGYRVSHATVNGGRKFWCEGVYQTQGYKSVKTRDLFIGGVSLLG